MRLAIFDMDGTLIDSQHLLVQSMSGAFAQVGRPAPTRRAILDLVGIPLPQSIAMLAETDDSETLEALLDAYLDHYHAEHDTGLPLFPGAIESINRLEEAGWLLGIATGKGRRGLNAALELHGLTGRFQATRSADEGPGKPHPSSVGDVADTLGIAPHRSVMIGDTSFDMESGRAAGCRTIGVTWGYHSMDRLRETGAEEIIDRFDDLLPVADALVPKEA